MPPVCLVVAARPLALYHARTCFISKVGHTPCTCHVRMAAGDTCELFLDLMSPPCRACALFCRINNLTVTERHVLIRKRQQLGADHLARNPLGKIPFLVRSYADGTPPYRLPESAAILTYLASTFKDKIPEHWLPRSNLEARAHVEAALHWYHGTIRAGAATVFIHKVLAAWLGEPSNDELAKEGLNILRRSLRELEHVWLQGGSLPFIGGAQPCVADLLVACELEQLCVLKKEDHGVDMAQLLEDWPAIRRWLTELTAATTPHYEQVHAVLHRAARKVHQQQPPTKDARPRM